MDIQFFNWLWFKLFGKKSEVPAVPIAVSPPSKESSATKSDEEVLRSLASQVNLLTAMNRMIDFRNRNRKESRPNFWFIFDARLHSRAKRLFIFNVVDRTVDAFYVAHGKGSDKNWTGYCEKFSNEPGSLCTSEGIVVTGKTYVSGKFGYALRLHGMESTNDKTYDRAVVFHGARYVSDDYVIAQGKCGRSEGCLAVDFKYSESLINKIKNGSIGIVWKG